MCSNYYNEAKGVKKKEKFEKTQKGNNNNNLQKRVHAGDVYKVK